MQTVLTIDLLANGQSSIDGQMSRSDRDLLMRIQEASAGYPDLRAVVRADASVPYGRVIHALDLLKQSGIGRIAFAVTPEGGGATPPPGTSATGEEAGVVFLKEQLGNCPYPEAADAEAMDAGAVTLIVAVDANGKARWVRILRDPGYGFGQAAAQCVQAMQFKAARGNDGAPLPGMTPPIRIQFSR